MLERFTPQLSKNTKGPEHCFGLLPFPSLAFSCHCLPNFQRSRQFGVSGDQHAPNHDPVPNM
jgi:hypothetical protein